MGISSVDVSFLLGVLAGGLAFGAILFAVGFDKGRKVSWQQRPGGANLSREVLAKVIGKRMQELVSTAKAREARSQLKHREMKLENFMTLPELQEYYRLQSQWQILRDERTSSAVERIVKEAEFSPVPDASR